MALWVRQLAEAGGWSGMLVGNVTERCLQLEASKYNPATLVGYTLYTGDLSRTPVRDSLCRQATNIASHPTIPLVVYGKYKTEHVLSAWRNLHVTIVGIAPGETPSPRN